MRLETIGAAIVMAAVLGLAVQCTPAAAFQAHHSPELPRYEWDENKAWETVRRDNDRYLEMLQKGEIKHEH